MCLCVCAAPVSSLHSASAGAVRSASSLASQIKDVTAAAPCPAAEQLQIDYTLTLFIFPPSRPQMRHLCLRCLCRTLPLSVSPGPRVEWRRAELRREVNAPGATVFYHGNDESMIMKSPIIV